MDLSPKQQTSEAIRQADSILILTGQHPSVDQTVAVMSLAMILRKYGKQVSAVITDSLPAAVQSLDASVIDKGFAGTRDFILKLDVTKVEVDKLRYEMADGKLNVIVTPFKGSFAPSDVTFDYGAAQAQYDVVIVLGVPARSRVDRIYEQNAAQFAETPVINIDFHRSNENYGAVNLIDSNASSLCEILVALSESLQSGIIDADIATPLLMGLVASTDRFTATHTTSKSLTVAAQMMAAGGKQQAVIKALYRDNRSGDRDRSDRDRSDRDKSGDRDRTNDREKPRSEMRRESVAPARQPEVRREPQPEARRESQSAPMAQPRREQPASTDADLPIIAPGHIEMSQPLPEPPMAPKAAPMVQAPTMAPMAAPMATPVPVPAPAQVVAPGQLPPEMSPLIDLNTQVASPSLDQTDSGMPMPSTMRNDG